MNIYKEKMMQDMKLKNFSNNTQDCYLMNSVKQELKPVFQKKASLHTLRHCIATHLLDAGVNLIYIQQLMGHASIKTTSMYLHLRDTRVLKIKSPDLCEDYGHIKISYNSCRNRYCPKCQGIEREQWILKQQANMLNEKYFHVVFTVPDDLNPVALKNQKVIYSLLLKAASETLQELTADKKYLGAQIGITVVLHTWGQTLSFHPHLHCIIPAGGLSSNNQWIKKEFFMPIKVIAKKFRGKFLDFFKKEVNANNIKFYGDIDYLNDNKKYQDLIDTLYGKKNWVV